MVSRQGEIRNRPAYGDGDGGCCTCRVTYLLLICRAAWYQRTTWRLRWVTKIGCRCQSTHRMILRFSGTAIWHSSTQDKTDPGLTSDSRHALPLAGCPTNTMLVPVETTHKSPVVGGYNRGTLHMHQGSIYVTADLTDCSTAAGTHVSAMVRHNHNTRATTKQRIVPSACSVPSSATQHSCMLTHYNPQNIRSDNPID
jgi:hypothetical protein